MKAILDASFILDFLLPDEHTKEVIEVFESYTQKNVYFISSSILPFEVANGLKSAVKSKRIKKEEAVKFLDIFLKLDIEFLESTLESTLKIAFEHDLSIYDASYIFLAKEKHFPLLTLDNRLKKLIK